MLLMHNESLYAESGVSADSFFNMSLGDLQEDLELSKKENKKGILIMWEIEDCPWCYRMKETILNQKTVQMYYRKNFLIFSINTTSKAPIIDFKGNTTTEHDMAVKSRAIATPTFIFYNLKGDPVTRYTGASKDVDEFMLLGEYVVSEAYKDKSMPFTKYKNLHRK